MPLQPTWTDIVIRLLLAMLAVGRWRLNQGAHGHAAGLRAIILVTLAAATPMIQAKTCCRLAANSPTPSPRWT